MQFIRDVNFSEKRYIEVIKVRTGIVQTEEGKGEETQDMSSDYDCRCICT